MVVEALLLPRNEHSDDLLGNICSQKQNPKLLTIIQNAAIYYQCIVTKREAGTMSSQQRDMHAKTHYKSFTVPSFLCWWKNVCGMTPPAWLTQDLMGQTTKNDAAKKLYTQDGLLWTKYLSCGREIRRDFNNIWDSFLVDGELPSGMQAEDIWEHLQLMLWFADRKAADKRKDIAAANAKAKAEPVVLTGDEPAPVLAEKQVEGAGAGGGKRGGKQPSEAALSAAAAKALERITGGHGGGGRNHRTRDKSSRRVREGKELAGRRRRRPSRASSRRNLTGKRRRSSRVSSPKTSCWTFMERGPKTGSTQLP